MNGMDAIVHLFLALVVSELNLVNHAFILSGYPNDQQVTLELPRKQYRAAVYDHAVSNPSVMASNHSEAVEQMMVNLREYEKQTKIAAKQNADMIVFPEYGIYGLVRERNSMRQYIEDIPDPRLLQWVPCDEQTRFPQPLDVIVFLSCLAKENSLYLVANYGDAKACSQDDPNCPIDGQYQYNTDLAFDRNGKLIAKYHKQNLFYENQFNEPVAPEYVFFDTEFGRFGMLTCFDILFHEPMMPLLMTYNITDIAFPTAWMDVMPFYSAIGYHTSVAMAYNVNLLSANIHLPHLRFQGSGISTPNGTNAFYYDRMSPLGKLLISDVAVVQRDSTIANNLNSKETTHIVRNQENENTPLMSVIFKDWYHIVLLNESSATLKVCQRELCCMLDYTADELMDLYALGVFDGKHIEEGKYYLQICVLFKCESTDVATCGNTTFDANTKFSFHSNTKFSEQILLPTEVTYL